MASKSTFSKLECSQATYTFIVYIIDGWYEKNWQKQSAKQFSHGILSLVLFNSISYLLWLSSNNQSKKAKGNGFCKTYVVRKMSTFPLYYQITLQPYFHLCFLVYRQNLKKKIIDSFIVCWDTP